MNNNFYKKTDKMLIANILDKYHKYEKTGISTYSNFLNQGKLSLVTNYLNSKRINYSVYPNDPFLEKKIIVFGEYQNFISYYKVYISNNITHSNILGTLFSLGIDEDLIGDIYVEDGYFYYTNLTRMNHFLKTSLVVIKNEVIKLSKVEEIILLKDHFESSDILVSSMRIDTIISRITNKSRNKVNNMIMENKILLNYQELNNNNVILKENDILSIRGFGKYRIGSINGFTRKDNIILEIIKYI